MELLIAGMVFAAVTVAIWAVIQGRTQAALATQARLDRVAGHLASDWTFDPAAYLRASRISSIPWVERVLGQLDLARSLDLMLIRADWSVRVSELLGFMAVLAGITFAAVMLILGSPLIAIPAAVIAALAPLLFLRSAVNRRRRMLEKQLVELLVMMANSLKGGFGLMQALEHAGRQLKDPLAKEIKQTIRATQIGESIEDAVEGLNVRVGSYDLEIVVTAILVQRSVGGNLAEILDNVAHTMRERERIRGEIQTLTAQQRLTGFVIAGLPPALGLIFFVLNPEYMITLFTEPMGRIMVIGAAVLEVIGAWLIKRIIAIEV